MNSMFSGATAFNQPLNSWGTSSVVDMHNMFNGALAFNQNIGSWDVTSVTDMEDMFAGVTLSTANYNSLLVGWDAEAVQSYVIFDGGNSKYTASSPASVARADLIDNYGWTITDGGARPNTAPSFSNPYPTNGSINQPLSLTWNITIEDPDADLFNWTIECSNSDSNSSNNDINGSKKLDISGLSYSTEYTVWVNATDGYDWTREWFTFTTTDEPNNPPNQPTNESPANNSLRADTHLTMSINISDADNDLMDVSFYWGNGNLMGNNTGVPSGSEASMVVSNLRYSTDYYWYVVIDDGNGGITRGPASGNWTYTTKKQPKEKTHQPAKILENELLISENPTDIKNIILSNGFAIVFIALTILLLVSYLWYRSGKKKR